MTDFPKLSTREAQLLDLAAAGFTDLAISNKLGVSETTVKTYWARIRSKIGPYSRTELVAKVIRRNTMQAVSALKEENRRLNNRLDHQSAAVSAVNLFRSLIDGAADAIIVTSKDGTILLVNESATELFGWNKDEIVGHPVSVLVPDRYRTVHKKYMAEYVVHPTRHTMGDHLATPALHKSGAEVQIGASLSAVHHGEETYVMCVVREVGPNKPFVAYPEEY